MRCLASFLRELCRFSVSACSVSVRVSYAGLKPVPPYPDVRPTRLSGSCVRRTSPMPCFLSPSFIPGAKGPCPAGSALSAGSLLLPRGASGEEAGAEAGLSVRLGLWPT